MGTGLVVWFIGCTVWLFIALCGVAEAAISSLWWFLDANPVHTNTSVVRAG